MTYDNAHSTLFFNYLRSNRIVIFLFCLIIIFHASLLYFLPANRRAVSNLLWISIELVKIPLAIMACIKSRDLIRKGWFFIVLYSILIFSAIVGRTYYDLVLHVYTVLPGSYFMFVAGNISVIIAFLQFSHSSEVSFKIKRQLNLLGLIFITIVIISYVINYKPITGSVTPGFIIYATITSVINISAFIIGLGIYWISIRNKNIKRKTVYIMLLSSIFVSFITNNFYLGPRLIAGKPVTGEYHDIFFALPMFLIILAALHEICAKEKDNIGKTYNLFYIPRSERIIPVLSVIIILVSFYMNTSKADLFLIKSIVLIFIPYCIFLLLFELYSYRSEDAILAVMEVSPAGVHITDRSLSNTFFVNQSLVDMYRGYNISPDFIVAGDDSPEKHHIKNIIPLLKSVKNFETIIQRNDGTEFNAQCRIIPARYYSYDIIITWIWDVTDRKKYEEMILDQKHSAETESRHLSELLDNLSNRMWSGYATMKVDDSGWPDFIFTGANTRITDRFSHGGDLIGNTITKIFPEPNPEIIEQFFEVLHTGESIRRELFIKNMNWFFNLIIFKTQDDEIGCLIDDITEKKQQEKDLIERERELATLLGNFPGMAYRSLNNTKCTMLFVSEGSRSLTGYSPDELTSRSGLSWKDIVHPDDRELVWNSMQDAIKNHENYNINYRLIARDSSLKHVWEKGLGIFNDKNELIFLEGFILDITKEKEAEAILRDFEMREREIDKARALGQMAGGIAHDLNNRLMAIGSCASLLEMKVKEQDIKKYTNGIQDSIKQSAELIDNLLTFARQSNRITGTFSIHTMLSEIILDKETEISNNIKITRLYTAANDNVEGDYKQIRRAVSGIISNAVEAMPLGGELTISTINRSINNTDLTDAIEVSEIKEYILINITDTGIGIEHENLTRIFDPFYTTKPVGKGSGLGLSAVYGAIQANKGVIKVDSTQGKGTSFIIYLPVIKD